MVEDTDTTAPPMFTIALGNPVTGQAFQAHFYTPHLVHLYFPEFGKTAAVWRCTYNVSIDDTGERLQASGDNWLQALLLAVKGAQRRLPEEQEEDWVTADGVPSWCIFPRLVPISWGYQTFRDALASVRAVEDKVQEEVQRRRDMRER